MGLGTNVIRFFNVINGNKEGADGIKPWAIWDFIRSDNYDETISPLEIAIICKRLEQKGYLFSVGEGNGSPPLNQSFYSFNVNEKMVDYGTYDFIAYGFPLLRQYFADSVIAIDVEKQDGSLDVGSAFLIPDKCILTCRHCIENMKRVTLKCAAINPNSVGKIYVPKDELLDLAVIELNSSISLDLPSFKLSGHTLLEQVLTLGYPPIPGFQSVLVAETGQVAGYLQSTTGQIIVESKSYLDYQSYILVTARVKGGNSGGPVVNELGFVVGIVTHLPGDGEGKADLLGYGAALPSKTILDFLQKIANQSDEIEQLEFKVTESGFSTLVKS